MMKQRVVWVDDTRDPFSNMWNPVATNKKYISGDAVIVWLKSYDDFTSWLDTALEDKCSRFPSLFCFDHDLGEEKNGLDCVKYLVEFCLDNNIELPTCICHSSNPVGRENIISYIDSYRKTLNK